MIAKWHQRILNVIFLNIFEWDFKSTDSRLFQEFELPNLGENVGTLLILTYWQQ